MNIGILSDIHGNIEALNAVLNEASDSCVERLILAGDFLGYYYHTREVLEKLEEWSWVGCRGNHEDNFEAWLVGDQKCRQALSAKYGHAYEIAAETLGKTQINLLHNLKHPVFCQCEGLKILISHGAPWSITQYIYPDAENETLEKFKAYQQDLVIIGHSHYQMKFEFNNMQIVNPGSVAQPRNGSKSADMHVARAQWAIFDTQTREIFFRTTHYDPISIHNEVKKTDPHLDYLSSVLTRQ